MENMPYQVEFDLKPVAAAGSPVELPQPAAVPVGWRAALPVLSDGRVTLRALKTSDAASLFSMLSTEEVRRFVSPPPPDVAGFERFIEWTLKERAAGRHICYAVVPAGYDVAIGIVQVRQLDPSFSSAELGAALGSPFWGTSVFMSAARLVIDFAFEAVGVHRMEARAAVQNGRGNGAMRKLGAVQEGVLRRSLYCRGQYFDQLLWSILADDWRQSRVELRPMIH
jgi:ribosomal-protein-alanine N-acetyltransferase